MARISVRHLLARRTTICGRVRFTTGASLGNGGAAGLVYVISGVSSGRTHPRFEHHERCRLRRPDISQQGQLVTAGPAVQAWWAIPSSSSAARSPSSMVISSSPFWSGLSSWAK